MRKGRAVLALVGLTLGLTVSITATAAPVEEPGVQVTAAVDVQPTETQLCLGVANPPVHTTTGQPSAGVTAVTFTLVYVRCP